MENLNKKNFFDSITAKYPRAMEQFHEWINNYKASVNWCDLFNEGVKTTYSKKNGTTVDMCYTKKFHEIPYEMQFWHIG